MLALAAKRFEHYPRDYCFISDHSAECIDMQYDTIKICEHKSCNIVRMFVISNEQMAFFT